MFQAVKSVTYILLIECSEYLIEKFKYYMVTCKTNIHGKYSWIFSDTAEAVCDTTPPPLLINLPTNPRCRNLQIPNLEILTMEMHKCSLWKIFTKADSRKLAQKLSFPASLVSFSFLQQSNAKIGLNFHETL